MEAANPTVTVTPGVTIVPSVHTDPSVTISLTTLIIILCAVVAVAAFIALLVGLLRRTAQSGTGVQSASRWPQIVFVCVGISATIGLCVAALSGNSAVPVSANPAVLQPVTEESTASAPTPAPTPEPATLSRPEGMPEELYNGMAELCYDLVYYSNYYCGTSYFIEGPPHNTAYDNMSRCWELEKKYEAVESSALLQNFESAFMDIWNYETFLTTIDHDNMVAGTEFAIQECEKIFAVDLSKIQFDAGNKTVSNDAVSNAAEPQGDYLTGKVFATGGSSSGGMYTEGQAFYFENGSVYAGLPGDSASSFKENSELFTPFEMSYSLNGFTITISGGGTSSQWTYDEAQGTINAGGTILEQVN